MNDIYNNINYSDIFLDKISINRINIINIVNNAILNKNYESIDILINYDYNKNNKYIFYQEILNKVIETNNITILNYIIKNFSFIELNIDSIFMKACLESNFDIISLLLDNNNFILTKYTEFINRVCRRTDISIIVLLSTKLNINDTIINNIEHYIQLSINIKNNQIFKYLLYNYDTSNINIDNIFKYISSYGNEEFLKIINNIYNIVNYNINDYFNIACFYKNSEIIKYLLENYFINIEENIDDILTNVFTIGNLDIFKLINNYNLSINYNKYFLILCDRGNNNELFEYIIENYEIDSIYIKEAFNKIYNSVIKNKKNSLKNIDLFLKKYSYSILFTTDWFIYKFKYACQYNKIELCLILSKYFPNYYIEIENNKIINYTIL